MKDSFAVITGASSGIGEEFARQLAERGYSLVLVARRKDRLLKLKEELESEEVSCEIYPIDLSEPINCYELMEYLANKKISIFINNAGFGDCSRFISADLIKEMDMIDVNVKAMHIMTKLMLRKFQSQNGGYLLNVASSAGLLPAGPYMATYYATKAYVTSLTQAVAHELKEEGSNIYIGCLCPGPVDTEFNKVAGVEFALKGITPQYCVKYALQEMLKNKTVIIPTMRMKVGLGLGKISPRKLTTAFTSHQQKKKIEKV